MDDQAAVRLNDPLPEEQDEEDAYYPVGDARAYYDDVEQHVDLLGDNAVENVPETPGRRKALRQVHGMLADLLDQQAEQSSVSVSFVSRTTDPATEQRRDLIFESKNVRDPKSKMSPQMKTLVQLIALLEISQNLLQENKRKKLRSLWYEDKVLWVDDQRPAHIANDLAATYGVRRCHLGLVATPQGFWAGDKVKLKVRRGDQVEYIDGKDLTHSSVICEEDLDSVEVGEEICWVLVVEKDTIFDQLLTGGITNHEEMPGRGMIITGRGEADIATRSLICMISKAHPDLPILGLFDPNPSGIQIFVTYKYGSWALAYDNEFLAASTMEPLGILPSQIESLDIPQGSMSPLSVEDHRVVNTVLRRSDISDDLRAEMTSFEGGALKGDLELLSSQQLWGFVRTELCRRL